MKWIGLAAIVVALLAGGLTGGSRLDERAGPSLPAMITARIVIAQIVFGDGHPAASITITPPARSGPLLTVTAVRRAGSARVERPISGMAAADYRRLCASQKPGAYVRANRCRPRLSPANKPYQ